MRGNLTRIYTWKTFIRLTLSFSSRCFIFLLILHILIVRIILRSSNMTPDDRRLLESDIRGS